MITIENEYLKAAISPKGAELQSLVKKFSETEFMWDANPSFWGKTSPVLFPIVGGLKDNSYHFNGKTYKLPRHGFARDKIFLVENQTADSVVFLLKEDVETLEIYPFSFELRLSYQVKENQISVQYSVRNTNNEALYFSVGGHPAFKIPIEPHLTYEDYYLEFSAENTLERYPLSADGLVQNSTQHVPMNGNKLPLTKALFYEDALVLKHLDSNQITIKSDKGRAELKFKFENFPYFGIWAAKNADFVCLEPWCGIADGVSHSQDFRTKEGINMLEAGEVFERMWMVEI